jgi:hypothetical protein
LVCFGFLDVPAFFFARVTFIGAGAGMLGPSSASSTMYSGNPDGVALDGVSLREGVPGIFGVDNPRGDGIGDMALAGISPTLSTTNDAGDRVDGAPRSSGVWVGVKTGLAGDGMSSIRTIGIASMSWPFAVVDWLREAEGRFPM